MPVTYPLGTNAGAIQTKGEDYFGLRIVNSDGSSATNESWITSTYITKFQIGHDQPEKEILGCSGRVLQTDEENVQTAFVFEIPENDSNIFNFLNIDVQNRYFDLLLPYGFGSSGTRKFFRAPLCKVQRGWGQFEQPDGKVTMTVKVLNNPSAFTGVSLSGNGSSITGWDGYSAASWCAALSGAANVSLIARNI